MNIAVFLGPTLPLELAQQRLQALYYPPCAAGDLLLAMEARCDAIAIIDGYFEHKPSVRHKEILYALSTGIPVFGAASLGALRAAELAPFGMIGVGAIAEAFAEGDLEDDDEVAVMHAPPEDGYRPLSDAMVNIRLGLDMAVMEQLISPATASSLVTFAKRLFYGERTWRAVLSSASSLGVCPEEVRALAALVDRRAPNAKRRDALTLLDTLRGYADSGRIPLPSVSFTFQHTVFFDALLHNRRAP